MFAALLARPFPLPHDSASTNKPRRILVTRFVSHARDKSYAVQATASII
jgi:hypothetical protein